MEKEFNNSTTVKHIAYNAENKLMTITYLKGSKYVYFNVPIETWELAEQAESIGRFVGSNIKGIYDYKAIL